MLLLEGEPWRGRVLTAVNPAEIEFPPYRAVFEALAEDAPERLDETAARAFEELKAEGLGGRAPDELFDRAVSWMEGRRLERVYDDLERQLAVASEAEQERLVREMQRVAAEKRAKFPRYKIAARRRGAPGT